MRIRFGDHQLDDRLYVLERAGRAVRLRPKVFDLLVHLARHRDRVVRREELVEVVWGTTAVGPGSLSGLVNELRQALGEDGRGASSIRTVHARGYQFVAEVIPEATSADAVGANRGALADGLRALIDRVTTEGSHGVLVEATPEGAAGAEDAAPLEGLVRDAEATGFQTLRLQAPEASLASPRRLAMDLIAALSVIRGRAAVTAALPLPARAWLEEAREEPVAGGASGASSVGPPGALGAAAEALSRLARRRPIAVAARQVDRGGVRFAQDLVSLRRRVGSAPVLWVVEARTSRLAAEGLRLLEAEAGFERWPHADEVERPLSGWLAARGQPPLPPAVEADLLRRLAGASEGAIREWAEWASAAARRADRSSLRRVEPSGVRRLRAGDG